MARNVADNKGSNDGRIVQTIGKLKIGFLFSYPDKMTAESVAMNLQISGSKASAHGKAVKLASVDSLDRARLDLADTIAQRETLESYRSIVVIDRPSFQRTADILRKGWTEYTPRAAAGYLDPCSLIGTVDNFDMMARDNDRDEFTRHTVKSAGFNVSPDGSQLATIYHWTNTETAAMSVRRLLRNNPDLDDDTRSIVRAMADRFELANRPCPPLWIASAEHASDVDYSLAAPSTREYRDGARTVRPDRLARACVGSDASGIVGDTGHGRGSLQEERGGYNAHGSPVTGEKSNRQTGKRIGRGSGGNARTENTPAILAYRAHYKPIAVKVIAPFFRAAVDTLHPAVEAENRRRSKLQR